MADDDPVVGVPATLFVHAGGYGSSGRRPSDWMASDDATVGVLTTLCSCKLAARFKSIVFTLLDGLFGLFLPDLNKGLYNLNYII
jgi:hypothetical protein